MQITGKYRQLDAPHDIADIGKTIGGTAPEPLMKLALIRHFSTPF
jgi:hypothetical protein